MSEQSQHRSAGSDSVSRREFLKGVGVAGAASVAGVRAPAQESDPTAPRQIADGLVRYPADGATIRLTVNGEEQVVVVRPSTTLLEVLREDLGLTGTKQVCDRGACGACTVLLNGRSVNSCLTLAVDVEGVAITTIEGLSANGLDPLQKAFIKHDACQCGYCIPGFVVRGRALLDEIPGPSPGQIRQGLAGNICRCGAYVNIFKAVEDAGTGGRS